MQNWLILLLQKLSGIKRLWGVAPTSFLRGGDRPHAVSAYDMRVEHLTNNHVKIDTKVIDVERTRQ